MSDVSRKTLMALLKEASSIFIHMKQTMANMEQRWNNMAQESANMKQLYRGMETIYGLVMSFVEEQEQQQVTKADVATQTEGTGGVERLLTEATIPDAGEASKAVKVKVEPKDDVEVIASKLTSKRPHSYIENEFFSYAKIREWIHVQQINCPEANCTESFNNIPQYTVHMMTKHKVNFYQCHAIDCKRSFTEKAQLETHLTAKHNTTNTWPCTVTKCTAIFRTNASLHIHKMFYHQVGIYSCKQCKTAVAPVRIGILRHSESCPGAVQSTSFGGQKRPKLSGN